VLLKGGRTGIMCWRCWEDLTSQPLLSRPTEPRARTYLLLIKHARSIFDTAPRQEWVRFITTGLKHTAVSLHSPFPDTKPYPCLRGRRFFKPKPFSAALQLPPAVTNPAWSPAKWHVAFPHAVGIIVPPCAASPRGRRRCHASSGGWSSTSRSETR